jgi:hypothetical protein
MKTKDLLTVWEAPDNSQLTVKQYTIRLPIRVAAAISALCDLYPKKTRTDIIGELLSTSLDELREALPSPEGEPLGLDDDGQPIFAASGMLKRFDTLSEQYVKELEKELAVGEHDAARPRSGSGATKRAQKAKGENKT